MRLKHINFDFEGMSAMKRLLNGQDMKVTIFSCIFFTRALAHFDAAVREPIRRFDKTEFTV